MPRVANGQGHGVGGAGAVLVRLGDVPAVGAHPVAEQFGVDSGAAGLGVFEFLQHQQAGALGEDEAVAIGVEGAAGVGGIVVSLRQGPHGREPAQAHGRHRGLAAAGDHHLGVVVLDGAEGVADGVGGGCAGRDHRGVGAAQARIESKAARWPRWRSAWGW